KTLLDWLDGKISRFGQVGASLLLTLAAVTTVVSTHFLIRHLQAAPVRAMSVVQLAIEMTVVIFPMVLYARRVIAELHRSRGEMAALSRRLEVAAEQAHQANRAKSQFLANMSHELRTPLNAIMGFSEVMKDQHLGPVNNPRYLSYAKDIHTSGRYLLGIINDILDLAKIEAGRMSLESAEEFDFLPTVEASLAMIESLGTKFDVTVINDMVPCDVRLTAVERMVRQILINLVGNAVKFTPAGGSVRLSGRRLADGGYELAVADSGVGMSEEDIVLALTPFGQISNMMSVKHTGTGLGLPLARAMMELHGGTLAIESVPRRGTTVLLTFPASRVGAMQAQKVA
ncbi:MAG: sensor histidine kinase, partial [Alphaproteobacteria bacterium]|nr:sensor histidine kinase [Alphaproteobacteria bacterium]